MLDFTTINLAYYYGYGGSMEGGYGQLQPIHYQVSPFYWTGGPENDSWFARAQKLVAERNLRGLQVLELGCAFGSLVRALRYYGVDAYGLDFAWPIQVATGAIERPEAYPPEAVWPEMAPFLIISDALTFLQKRSMGEYDVILSNNFLECLTDLQLSTIIPEMNRVAELQIHVVDSQVPIPFYNSKTLDQWKSLPFKNTTVITD